MVLYCINCYHLLCNNVLYLSQLQSYQYLNDCLLTDHLFLLQMKYLHPLTHSIFNTETISFGENIIICLHQLFTPASIHTYWLYKPFFFTKPLALGSIKREIDYGMFYVHSKITLRAKLDTVSVESLT